MKIRYSLKAREKQKKLNRNPSTAFPKKIIRALRDYSPDPANPTHLPFIKGHFFHVIGRENDRFYYEVANPLDPHLSGFVPVSFFEVVADTVLNEERTRERFSNSSKVAFPFSSKRVSSDRHSQYSQSPFNQHHHHHKHQPLVSPPLHTGPFQPQFQYANSSTPTLPSLSPASPRIANSYSPTTTTSSAPSQPKKSLESVSVTSRVGAMLYAIVLYDFEAERVDELDAKEGDNIIIVAQSNDEWFVAKPIGRLGGPGLIPVSYIEIRDLVTGAVAPDPLEACRRACVPKVEEWKQMTQHYQNSSVSLGRLSPTSGARDSGVDGYSNNANNMDMDMNMNMKMSNNDHMNNEDVNGADADDAVYGVAISADSPEVDHGSYDFSVANSTGQYDQQPSSHDSQQAVSYDSPHNHPYDEYAEHNGDGYRDSQAYAYGSPESPRQEILSSHTPVLAPISASIARYIFHRDTYWYVIDAKLEDGSCWELQRYYEDFAKLQRNLLQAFPHEAGRVEGVPRSLPFMPGPVRVVTDAISNGRRQALDDYVKRLLCMPPHISRCQFVRQLFAPRDGDFEIDPVVLEEENSQMEQQQQEQPAHGYAEEPDTQLDQSPSHQFLGSEVFDHDLQYDQYQDNHDDTYEDLVRRTHQSLSLDREPQHLDGGRVESAAEYPFVPDINDLQQHYYDDDQYQARASRDSYQMPEQSSQHYQHQHQHPQQQLQPPEFEDHYRHSNSHEQYYSPRHGRFSQQHSYSPPNSTYTSRETPVVSPTTTTTPAASVASASATTAPTPTSTTMAKPTMLNTTPPSLSLPFPSPPASSILSATPSSSNLPLQSPSQPQPQQQQASTPTTAMMKLKVHYNGEWLIIRMPERLTHESLMERLRERLRIVHDKGILLRAKKQPGQEEWTQLGPAEWADVMQRMGSSCGGKITLWAKEVDGDSALIVD